MPDVASPLQYRQPETPRPLRGRFVERMELAATGSVLLVLLVIMPGLYKLGAIDVIVLNQLGGFSAMRSRRWGST
jgi:hypothetical protein